MVDIIDFIAGIDVKLLRGLNNLNVLITETLLIPGISESKLVSTTMKSSQFHASLKYVNLSRMKPCAIILITASEVKIIMNKGSQ